MTPGRLKGVLILVFIVRVNGANVLGCFVELIEQFAPLPYDTELVVVS